jgi:chromosome segregation ATPase
MKKFVITILAVLCALTSFSQTLDYPRYEKDSLGQTIVLLTIDQAMALDNNSELLGLFEKLNSQIGEYDSACIKVINEKEKVIAIQKLEIAALKSSLATKDQQIIALQAEIASYIAQIAVLNQHLRLQQDIIDDQKKQIRKLRFKNAVGGIGGSLAIVGLIVAFILIN